MVGVYQICQKEDSCEVDLVHVGRLRVVFQLSGDGLVHLAAGVVFLST